MFRCKKRFRLTQVFLHQNKLKPMSSEKTRILLVDDEPDILEFISYNLNKEGFEVFTSTNGRDAI